MFDVLSLLYFKSIARNNMKNFNAPIPEELKEKLDKYCAATGIAKKKVVEKALARYLANRKELK